MPRLVRARDAVCDACPFVVTEMQSMQAAAAAAAAVQLGSGGALSNQALFNTFRSDDRKVSS